MCSSDLVVRATTAIVDPHYNRTISGPDLVAFQRLVRRVPIADPVLRYALSLVRTSRPKSPQAPDSVKKYVAFGAGPRAGQNLVLAAKARAAMEGRAVPDLEDVDAVAFSVLRHRVVLNFQAEAEGVGIETILALGGRGRAG